MFGKEKAYQADQQTDYFRQPTMDVKLPKKPEPVMAETNDLEGAIPPRNAVTSVFIGKTGPDERQRRETRNGDMKPFRLSQESLLKMGRSDSQRSTASTRSTRSLGLPIGGPKLPRFPSRYREDPFADSNALQNPFKDDRRSQSSTEDMAPAPLSLQKRPSMAEERRSTTFNLTLTDPRVVDSRKLAITNGSNPESPTLPFSTPPVPPKAAMGDVLKRLQLQPPSRGLPASPQQGYLASRFSATTAAESPSLSVHRKSNVSVASSTTLPQFRGVDSWVDHQTNRAIRHPSEIPEDAKTVAGYDAKSDISGMDTRRTFYSEA